MVLSEAGSRDGARVADSARVHTLAINTGLIVSTFIVAWASNCKHSVEGLIKPYSLMEFIDIITHVGSNQSWDFQNIQRHKCRLLQARNWEILMKHDSSLNNNYVLPYVYETWPCTEHLDHSDKGQCKPCWRRPSEPDIHRKMNNQLVEVLIQNEIANWWFLFIIAAILSHSQGNLLDGLNRHSTRGFPSKPCGHLQTGWWYSTWHKAVGAQVAVEQGLAQTKEKYVELNEGIHFKLTLSWSKVLPLLIQAWSVLQSLSTKHSYCGRGGSTKWKRGVIAWRTANQKGVWANYLSTEFLDLLQDLVDSSRFRLEKN